MLVDFFPRTKYFPAIFGFHFRENSRFRDEFQALNWLHSNSKFKGEERRKRRSRGRRREEEEEEEEEERREEEEGKEEEEAYTQTYTHAHTNRHTDTHTYTHTLKRNPLLLPVTDEDGVPEASAAKKAMSSSSVRNSLATATLAADSVSSFSKAYTITSTGLPNRNTQDRVDRVDVVLYTLSISLISYRLPYLSSPLPHSPSPLPSPLLSSSL